MLTVTLLPGRPYKMPEAGGRDQSPSLPFHANKMIKEGKKITDSSLG
jgi:hypothetical protein